MSSEKLNFYRPNNKELKPQEIIKPTNRMRIAEKVPFVAQFVLPNDFEEVFGQTPAVNEVKGSILESYPQMSGIFRETSRKQQYKDITRVRQSQPETVSGNIENERQQEEQLTLSPHVYEVLNGRVIKAEKPDKKGNPIFIVTDGSGQYGIEDMLDSQKWGGIMRHSKLSADYTVDLLRLVINKGVKGINLQDAYDSMVFSHSGRRQSDDAKNHPKETKKLAGSREYKIRKGNPNEWLGLRNLKGRVPDSQYQIIASLAHKDVRDPEIYERWEVRASTLIDHTTEQTRLELEDRMSRFFVNYFKFEGQNAETDKADKKVEIKDVLKTIIDKRKEARKGTEGAEDITLKDAMKLIKDLGVTDKSSRVGANIKILTELVLYDAETIGDLELLGIDHMQIGQKNSGSDDSDKPDEFFEKYIDCAKDQIIAAMDNVYRTKEGPEREEAISQLAPKSDNPNMDRQWMIPYYKRLYDKHLSEKSTLTASKPVTVFQAPAVAVVA